MKFVAEVSITVVGLELEVDAESIEQAVDAFRAKDDREKKQIIFNAPWRAMQKANVGVAIRGVREKGRRRKAK